MPLSFQEKQAVVAEVTDVAQISLSAVVADNLGLCVTDVTQLRKQAREQDVYFKVAKNTLIKRAIKGTHFECMETYLKGPTVIAFSKEDPGAAARLLRDFVKTNEKLAVKGLCVSGTLFDASKLKEIASLPTYDEAVSMLMSVMIAPITQFVRTTIEPTAKLVRTLAAVAEAKK